MQLAAVEIAMHAPCVLQWTMQLWPRAMAVARPAKPARLLVWGLDFGMQHASNFENHAGVVQASRSVNCWQASHPWLLLQLPVCSLPSLVVGSLPPALSCSAVLAHTLLIAYIDVGTPIAPHTPAIPSHSIRRLRHRDSDLPASARVRQPTTQNRQNQDVARCLEALEPDTLFLGGSHGTQLHSTMGLIEKLQARTSALLHSSPQAVVATSTSNDCRP